MTYADPAQRYKLNSRIATGGMGEVWRGTDTVLGRPVAIKLLKLEYADDPGFRTRFETEARHAAALHHPNVAAIFDFGDSTGHRPYLVMELVDGQPLSALLRPGRQMPADQARDLLGQAADALAAAHAAGIVHRDVKPANLLVTPDRQLKITDFGIARAADGMSLTETGQVMGTPQYLSPEQAEGGTATQASDVYSLGVVLFECLAGHRPFQGSSPVATALAHIREPIPDLPPNVPADLAAVVRRALAKNPHDRFRNAAAFAAALRDPSKVGPVGPVGPVAPVKPPPNVPPAAATAVLPTLPPARGVEPTTGFRTEPERRRSGIAPWLMVVPILLLLGLVAWAFWQALNEDNPGPQNNTPSESVTSQQTSQATERTRIEVDPNDYVGRPVDDVVSELGALGFVVHREEEDNSGGQSEGMVTQVDPSGSLAKGSTITVSYWGAAPEETPTEPTETPSVTDTPTLTTEIPTTNPGNGNGGDD